jgi:hypothetical protein
MSCYMLDVAFSLFCGPIYKCACHLWHLLDRKRQRDVMGHSLKVRECFLEAQGFFTVSVLIATVVRLEQHPPLFEITFLQCLNWTLALSYYAMFWSLLSDLRRWYKGQYKTREFSLPNTRWTAQVSFGGPLYIFFYTLSLLGLGLAAFIRSQSQRVLPTNKRLIIDYCTKYSSAAPYYENGK